MTMQIQAVPPRLPLVGCHDAKQLDAALSLSNNRDVHSLQRSEWSHTKKLVNWIFIKTAKETHLKDSEDAIVNIWHYWLEGNRFQNETIVL